MMKKLILLLLLPMAVFGLVDLEKEQQDFVLHTKKITIEEFPDAFNPSIIRWQGKILMSFRTRDPLTKIADRVGLIWLDEQFNPVSKPQLLNISMLSKVQDPRLIIVNDRLYFPFSAKFQWNGKEEQRMCIGELYLKNGQFFLAQAEPILHFEGDNRKFEKNWVPFEYNGYLLLSYSIEPHRVFLPFFGEQKCLLVDYSESHSNWEWGEIRGGTPALRVDNQYLAFFHSSVEMQTVQSKGKKMTHYFMGAYTFQIFPPFRVNKISPKPIVGPNYYSGEVHKTWKPLRVVFPGGYLFDEKYIWLFYGRQDHEIWVATIDKKGLLESLTAN